MADPSQEVALEILRLFGETGTEGWDLHGFFELVAGDNPERRVEVFDTVEKLVSAGFLESRGSDFYTITETGEEAAASGRIDGW